MPNFAAKFLKMLHLHSILRWALLILLVIAVVKAFSGLRGKKEFTEGDSKVGLFLMMFAHLQLVLGLILYFTEGWAAAPMAESMSGAEARFWKVEHIGVMILAIVGITIGRIRTKKLEDAAAKHKVSLIFYGIALILILSRIPWTADRLF